MAYKYQPIKDEIFLSDTEEVDANDDVEEITDKIAEPAEEDDEDYVEVKPKIAKAEKRKYTKRAKKVQDQGSVLILETIEAGDPTTQGIIPEGSMVLASGNESGEMLGESGMLEDGSMLEDNSMLEDSSIIDTSALEDSSLMEDSSINNSTVNTGEHADEELEDCHLCGKKVLHLDKHILANHGEKVECQLCNNFFPVGNLRWHILKEHCHNKVTECSLCEQKFVTKNALKNHIKQIHLSETSTCHICHKEYKDLYHHVKYFHERIRNFECSYCEKKFQAKKLLYNHVQSIHLGEKTRCPDCHKDISVDNFSRHVRETHERVKKPCPHCEKEFAMSNLSRHIRQVHNNESTECPDCGKALTISNLNKHIKSVHKKMKKTCEICNEEVPYSSISVHKRKVHGIGKAMDDVTPRGPNLKLRKRYRQMIDSEMEFDRLAEAGDKSFIKKRIMRGEDDDSDEDEDEDEEEDEDEDENEDEEEDEEQAAELGTKTIQVGDRNFTFSFA